MSNSKVKFEHVAVEEGKMPILKVTMYDQYIGYLSPFRVYKFQVSQTVDGEWDLGSSDVVGLANIVKAFDLFDGYGPISSRSSAFASNHSNLAKNVFKQYALVALSGFFSYHDAPYDGPATINSIRVNDRDIFNEFLDKCYLYVRKFV